VNVYWGWIGKGRMHQAVGLSSWHLRDFTCWFSGTPKLELGIAADD